MSLQLLNVLPSAPPAVIGEALAMRSQLVRTELLTPPPSPQPMELVAIRQLFKTLAFSPPMELIAELPVSVQVLSAPEATPPPEFPALFPVNAQSFSAPA